MRLFTSSPLIASSFVLALGLTACSADTTKPSETTEVQAPVVKIVKDDKFAYANYDKVRMTHLSLIWM